MAGIGRSSRAQIMVPWTRLASAEAALPRPAVLVSFCGCGLRRPDHWITRDVPIDEMIVMLCVSGRGHFRFDGRWQPVTAGQALILPPGIPHAYHSDATDPWTVWWVHLRVDDLEGYRDWPTVIDVPDIARAVGLVSEIISELETDITDANVLIASGAAWHLLMYLAAAPRLTADPQGRLERARDVLRERMAERVSLADLAAGANLSPAYFATLFRERFGVSVIRYQTELRMARARHLLDTTDRTIAHVAAEVGYSDPFYFSRQFSRVHRMTPRAYRERP
jgi:AraC-like DNA-binding protein